MEKENVLDTLTKRGFVEQVTHEELRDLLGKESVPFYIGFDPTADSLHIGHFISLMVASYMQKAGHKPILLIEVLKSPQQEIFDLIKPLGYEIFPMGMNILAVFKDDPVLKHINQK